MGEGIDFRQLAEKLLELSKQSVMRRKALLVYSPGEGDDYIAGIENDIVDLRSFLESPQGGLWTDIEVAACPTRAILWAKVQILKPFEYSLVAFSGHGGTESDGSTILDLGNGESIDANILRTGSPKQTVIVDCCRAALERIQLSEKLAIGTAIPQLDDERCRKLYDSRIRDCPSPMLAVLNACQEGELAYAHAKTGSYYIQKLMACGEEWTRQRLLSDDNDGVLSVLGAHRRAEKKVIAETGERQNPEILIPKDGPYFPFCVAGWT